VALLFPLKHREIIRGCEAHKAAGLGCATDYEADYEPIYAPIAGTIWRFIDGPGGNWVALAGKDGRLYEFAHLDHYTLPNGPVNAGDIIGISGNTGTLTSGKHLHVQIKDSKGRRLNPLPILARADLPKPQEAPVAYNEDAGRQIRDNANLHQFEELVVRRTLEHARQGILGEVDQHGLDLDVQRVMQALQNGTDFEMGAVIDDYIQAGKKSIIQ
jgi:hypothetical protein